jgi:peptide/nickel transport system substrate-binding protein
MLLAASCAHHAPPDTLVMIIESSPANLDPRVGTDAQSERIGKLIFDSLVRRDEHFQLQPALAERWEVLDPLTYIFHLRRDVRFHDGTPLTARDVKWTFDSVINGTVISAKTSTFKLVSSVEAPDDHTVVFRLREPYATLLWNVSDGAMGIVPYGSGKDFNQHLNGTGPFKFVSAVQDGEVVIARNETYWGDHARVPRVRFAVIPDSTTRALELRKGSADVAVNALSADVVVALQKEPNLEVNITPGTIYAYLAFNLRDPLLRDERVRQALGYAIDRDAIIKYLWRGLAQPAASVLPPQHWAYDADVRKYSYDPERARQILDQADYKPGADGVRFHLVMKTSTEETSRLMAAVFQQQLRQVGIVLDIRSFEFATFYSDVVKGAFQVYSLRWIGGNEDPDIFEHVFHSASFPPKRANRSYYVNPRVDALIDQGRRELDPARRKAIYGEVQRILAEELPYINLWYLDNVIVHSKRVRDVEPSASGNYDFLRRVVLAD